MYFITKKDVDDIYLKSTFEKRPEPYTILACLS